MDRRRLVFLFVLLLVGLVGLLSTNWGAQPRSIDVGDQSEVVPEGPALIGTGAAVETSPTSHPIQNEAPARPWFVRVRVVDDERDTPRAIEGATVRVYLNVGGRYERLATGVSGPDGAASLDLRALSKWSRNQIGLGRLEVVASAPGHFRRRGAPGRIERLLDDDLRPTPWSVEMDLVPSPVVRGRILRRSGVPLAHAAVYLVPIEGKPLVGSLVFSDPDGRYAVPVPRAGTYRLRAHHRDVWGRHTAPMVLDGRSDVEAPDLKLKAPPGTPGSVRFTDGTPVAELTFAITHPRFSATTATWAPRLGPVQVRTDSRGEFRVVLPYVWEPDKADFRVQICGVDSEDTGFDPHARRFELTVPAHRLRLLLRDAHGEPLRGQPVSFRSVERAWPIARGTTDQQGDVSLFVPPGTKGRLLVLRPGNALFTLPVTVPETGNESALRVDVSDRDGAGTLGFRIRTPAGAPVFPLDVDVRTAAGDDVIRQTFKSDADRIVLAPGAYVLTLWSSAPHARKNVPALRSFVRLEETFWIRDGDETVLDVVWRPTAALALRISAPGATTETLLAGSCASVEPLVEGGRRRDLHFCGRGFPGKALAVDAWMFSSWLFEPGIVRITLEAEGYLPLTRDIRLVGDTVTRTELTLTRAP